MSPRFHLQRLCFTIPGPRTPAQQFRRLTIGAILSASNNRNRSTYKSPPGMNPGEHHRVYILTLSTTPSLSDPLTKLRQKYFPPAINYLEAHLTLFHALPHEQIDIIITDISKLASETAPMRIATGEPKRLKRGVWISVAETQGANDIRTLRDRLRESWHEFLSLQDRQPGWHAGKPAWTPHWTVMNKMDDPAVKQAFKEITSNLQGAVGNGLGLTMWEYLENGRWDLKQKFPFMGNAGADGKSQC